MMSANEKLERLQALLVELESVVVAFSAGVDSTFLLRVAKDVLDDKALAATAVSESYPAHELEEAKQLARDLGVELRLVYTTELANPDYAKNAPDRCYHCKTELFTNLAPLARIEGYRHLVYGAIVDDLTEYRPGMRAAKEWGARAPLAEVGLTKAEIRELSKEMGLPTWDKPGLACLSSRIPYGQPVTREKLAQIEAAENVLHSLGFRQVRVRHHDAIARIELPSEDLPRLFAEGHHATVTARLKEIGFQYVTVDLQGYRTGSLNEPLKLILKRS